MWKQSTMCKKTCNDNEIRLETIENPSENKDDQTKRAVSHCNYNSISQTHFKDIE